MQLNISVPKSEKTSLKDAELMAVLIPAQVFRQPFNATLTAETDAEWKFDVTSRDPDARPLYGV